MPGDSTNDVAVFMFKVPNNFVAPAPVVQVYRRQAIPNQLKMVAYSVTHHTDNGVLVLDGYEMQVVSARNSDRKGQLGLEPYDAGQ